MPVLAGAVFMKKKKVDSRLPRSEHEEPLGTEGGQKWWSSVECETEAGRSDRWQAERQPGPYRVAYRWFRMLKNWLLGLASGASQEASRPSVMRSN